MTPKQRPFGALSYDLRQVSSWENPLVPFLRRIVELGVFGFGRMDHPKGNGRVSVVTLPETNSSHLKIGYPKRKIVFQPSIFKCYVSFREGNKHSRNRFRPQDLEQRGTGPRSQMAFAFMVFLNGGDPSCTYIHWDDPNHLLTIG